MAVDAAQRRAFLGMLPLADGSFNAGDRRQFTSVLFRINGTVIVIQSGASFLSPVEIAKSIQQIYTEESWSTPQDQIDAGFPIAIQPTVVSDSIWEEKYDLGSELASAVITLSYLEETLDGSVTTTPTISYSSDDVTYYSSSAKQVLATNFRYVKIKLTGVGDDRTSLVKISDIRTRVDVKTETESGQIEVTANPTTINFTTSFIGIPKMTYGGVGSTPLIVQFTNYSASSVDVSVYDTSGVDASGAGVYIDWNANGPIG